MTLPPLGVRPGAPAIPLEDGVELTALGIEEGEEEEKDVWRLLAPALLLLLLSSEAMVKAELVDRAEAGEWLLAT